MSQDRPCILLIDDDEVDAYVLKKAFSGGRTQVDFTHLFGGDELKDYLAPKLNKTPNVILLDINMPAMDGFEVLRNLRADDATKAIPVVMFTTSNLEADVEKAYYAGANSYFVKPGSMGELKSFVDSFEDYWFRHVRLPSLGA